MEEKEYNPNNQYSTLPFLLSLPLSVYCKTIKEGLIGAGIVKEDIFIQSMCDSFIKSYHLQNDRDSDSITIRNHVFQKLKEGIEFLISIHCIIRKSMFSVVTLTWYGIHGIAQSVKEETNEEIELKNKPLYIELMQCQSRKKMLEKAIMTEEQFKKELVTFSTQQDMKNLSQSNSSSNKRSVKDLPNIPNITSESLFTRGISTPYSSLCDELISSSSNHCYLLTDLSADLFYEITPDGKDIYLSSTYPIEVIFTSRS